MKQDAAPCGWDMTFDSKNNGKQMTAKQLKELIFAEARHYTCQGRQT
jgi:hypothetical protein